MDAHANRFLESFSPAGSKRLVDHLIYQELSAGDYLFREGDPSDGVYLVIEGEVEALKNPGDREQVLASFQAGDYLGDIAVLDGQVREIGARARGEASVAKIPSAVLLDVLDMGPVTLTLHLFENVLGQLRKSNDLFVQERVRQEKLSLVRDMAGALLNDLRNPVEIILSAIELIWMNHSDAETADCCQKVQIQCDRLTAMAGDLQEFSRGEKELRLERTDTGALMRQFVAFNEDTFPRTGIQLIVEDDPADITVDSMRLQRALQNLLTNAVQALHSKPKGRIDVRAWVRDSILHIAMRDNGTGIPAGIENRIFEPFVTHGRKSGAGLGLAIAKNIVAAHRGKITFETQAGQGTEFLVRIPQDAASKPVE
jgi:signal transduction histidine kinase